MTTLLIAIILLLQVNQQDNHKEEPRELIGTNVTRPEDFLQKAREPSVRTYDIDYLREAVEAGWGSSKWDNGTFEPGIGLEEARRIERNDYFAHLFKNIGIVIAILSGLVLFILLVRYLIEQKKKKNPWRDSSFTSDY